MRMPNDRWRTRVARALLAFWDERRRDLPWRCDTDAYRIWVSEIMLQQTRVEAVIPYYERWMARFPTLAALAAAPIDDVLLVWQGLGYYGRARNLHRAARKVMMERAGRLPRDAAALREIPGIGDYTAGAIASIAFGKAVPAVDGNVRRVLARLLDVADPAPRRVREVAAALVPRSRPGDFNQAMMELGATVCTPRAPGCAACPLLGLCRAARNGTQHERPARRSARAVPAYDVGCAILLTVGGRMLLVRRPARGLLAGLWEFPGAVPRPGESLRRAAARAAREAGTRVDGRTARALGCVPHAFTHRKETYHAFRFWLSEETPMPVRSGQTWAFPSEFPTLPLPTAQRRIAALLRNGNEGRS